MYSSQGGNIPSGVPVPGEDLEHRGGRGSNPNREEKGSIGEQR